MLVESEGQADLLIKKGDEPESVFALNDVYQTTPAGDQVETQTVAPGETATYQVKVENDSTDSTEHKTFVVKATESSESGWTVTYEVGATNITGQITGSGGYTTSGLVPGGSEIITVEMTPDSTVEPGTTKSTTVQAFLDASDTTVQDAVQAITTATSIPNLTAGCTPCAEKTGEPIQTGTGEYFTDPQVDIDLGGPLPLSFSRTYASRLSLEGEVQSSLEPNWMHNFDIRLKKKSLPARTATVVYGRGNIITFQQPPQQLEWFMQSSPEDTEGTIYQLREGPNREYWFMDPNRKLVFRFYDAPSLCGKGNFSSFGLLREIQDRNGNTLSLTYDDFCNLSEVSDGLGRTLTFTYDASGHLTQLTDGTRILTYTNTDGVLTGFTDAMGNTTIYLYDTTNTAAGPLLVAIERPLGNRHHTQTYDTQGRVIQQVDAFANATTFEYDTPAPGTTTITDPLGNRRTTGHERQKVMTEATDAQGQTSSFAYDDHDRPTSSTDRLGNTTAISYQPESGLPTSMTDARGNTGGFTYTPQDQTFGSVTFTFNNLTRVDYPDGTHKEFSYDAKGNVIERVDQAGNVWTYTYNSRGQILTETNPEEGVTTSTYNDDGTLASSKDAETGATTYEYDNLKRLTNIINPDGTSIRKNYNLNNMVIFETDENGGTVSSTYDANGNIIATIDPLGNRTQYTLDSMDRQVQTMNRLGKVSTITFDPPGRLASSTDPNGNALQYRYNENGWTTQVTDGAGKVWQTGYDAEGRIISETSPLGITMRHEWDQAGKKTKVTDALGHSTSFTWDALNRMSSVTDPVGKQTQYSYDSLGNFSGITHSGLGSATYIYNALRLLTTLTDFGGKSWDFGYTPMGRLSFLRDPLGDETRFSYDPRGRLSQTTYPTGEIETITYDGVGNILSVQHSDGTDLQQAYDALDRLTSANGIALSYDAEDNTTNTQDDDVHFGAAYDDAGRLKSVTYNNGAFTVTYTYDQRNLLTQVTDSLTGTTIDFTYDDDGKPTAIQRSNGITTSFSWDADNRLTRIQDGAIADQQYTFNAAGEVTQATQTLPLEPANLLSTQTDSFTYDDASQVSAPGYAYDARGRQTASPTHRLTWDGADRLTGTGTATLEYNGLGNLIRRTGGLATTHYYYNHAIALNPIMAEQDEGTGQFLRYSVWTPDGELLYMIDASAGNTVYFHHFDHLGSTLFLTDASGAVTDSYAYTPYGFLLEHNGSNPQPFTFLGKHRVRQEGTSGLYHIRARYYDAVTTKFLSRDPNWPQIKTWDGLNPYLYARSNPVQYADFTGKGPGKVIGKVIGQLVMKNLGTMAQALGEAGARATLPPSTSSSLSPEQQRQAAVQSFLSAANGHLRTMLDKPILEPTDFIPHGLVDFITIPLDVAMAIGQANSISRIFNLVVQSNLPPGEILTILDNQYGTRFIDVNTFTFDPEENHSWDLLFAVEAKRAFLRLYLSDPATERQIEQVLCELHTWGFPSVAELQWHIMRTQREREHPREFWQIVINRWQASRASTTSTSGGVLER